MDKPILILYLDRSQTKEEFREAIEKILARGRQDIDDKDMRLAETEAAYMYADKQRGKIPVVAYIPDFDSFNFTYVDSVPSDIRTRSRNAFTENQIGRFILASKGADIDYAPRETVYEEKNVSHDVHTESKRNKIEDSHTRVMRFVEYITRQ